MKKIVINSNEKGIIIKNGRFAKVIDSGKYWVSGNSEVIICSVDDEINCSKIRMSELKDNSDFASKVQFVTVPNGFMSIHCVDGFYHDVAKTGVHAYWKDAGEHEFMEVDICDYKLDGKVPEYIIESMIRDNKSGIMTKSVREGHVGVLSVFGKYEGKLMPGRHAFVCPAASACVTEEDDDFFLEDANSTIGAIKVAEVPTEEVNTTIPYQEVLTSDKAEVRMNMTVSYKVTDCVKYGLNEKEAQAALFKACKLALRKAACDLSLDQLLESRTEIGDKIYSALKEKEQSLGLEVIEAGVMDMVLPGNIRDIMNTVLEAEKKAQANVITRREEVASTRSLLNTAKMLDENPTLYRLKEMECLERICSNVGSVNVGGGGETLNQLLGLLRK